MIKLIFHSHLHPCASGFTALSNVDKLLNELSERISSQMNNVKNYELERLVS
jgi:hypothetical protein